MSYAREGIHRSHTLRNITAAATFDAVVFPTKHMLLIENTVSHVMTQL